MVISGHGRKKSLCLRSFIDDECSKSLSILHELRLPLLSVNSNPRYRFSSVYLDLCYHIFLLRLYYLWETFTRTVLEQSELPDHRDLNVQKIHVGCAGGS